MSLLARHRERRSNPAALRDVLSERRRSSTHAGVVVDADMALRHSAVWACVGRIADPISTLQLDVFRGTGPSRTLLPSPSLLRDPHPDIPASAWRRQLLVSALLRGNAYGLVLATDQGGYPLTVEVLHPDLVEARRPAGVKVGPVEWFVDGVRMDKWPLGRLWHFPAWSAPGTPLGLSPIRYAAQTIGLGLGAETFGARWFADAPHPAGILKTDARIDDDAVAARIKARFVNAIAGREPAVLGMGLEYQPLSIAPDESQFLDTIQANRATIAGFYGLQPEAIGATNGGSSITYANVEQRGLDDLTFVHGHWMARLDEALSALLPRGTYVRHNADGLLRVDAKTRAETQKLGLEAGWLSVNEVRDDEDRPPVEGGDTFTWQSGGGVEARGVAEMVQKLWLGVGKVITADEARLIVNTAGGTLPLPGPFQHDTEDTP